jgi:hypothetical protein
MNTILDDQRTNLQLSMAMESKLERNNETLENPENNIGRVKEILEERIQVLQYNLLNEERLHRPANKVIEILGNGREIICKEIQENRNDIRTTQERIINNMELFVERSAQEIRETIVDSRYTDEFNDFTQRLITLQENMKEFNRMETQHEIIFKKGDENIQ